MANDLPDLKHIVAVHNLLSHRIAFRSHGNILDRQGPVEGRAHGIQIVLANKNHRQFPQRGQRQALVKSAHIGRAFAKETQGHIRLAPVFRGKGNPRGNGHMAADNGVAAHEALRHVKIVHGAAPALGTAIHLAEQFRHSRIHIPDPGQIMAVVPIGRHDIIRGLNRRHRPNRHRLLAVVQVQKATDFAPRIRTRRFFLKAPNANHVAVERKHKGLIHPDFLAIDFPSLNNPCQGRTLCGLVASGLR